MILSIIIPVFNEEKTVNIILSRVLSVKLPQSMRKEIIVVDDGSNDNSKFTVLNSEFIKKIKFLSHGKNLGKGAAVRSALEVATGDLVIVQDGDLEYNPDDYPRLLSPILAGRADIVYGSRLVNYPLKLWGKNKTILPLHLLANKILTALTNFLFTSKLTDMETGYKVFKKDCLKGIEIQSNGFNFEPEITAKSLKKGYRILEVPIKVKPRTYREGKKIGWIDGLKAVLTLLKYRFYD